MVNGLLHTNINEKQNSAQQVFVLNNLLKVFSIYENQQGMVNENLNKTYFLNNIIFTSLNNKSKISIDNFVPTHSNSKLYNSNTKK